jgi:hypothetical protein
MIKASACKAAESMLRASGLPRSIFHDLQQELVKVS